jgi:hypothetical protein
VPYCGVGGYLKGSLGRQATVPGRATLIPACTNALEATFVSCRNLSRLNTAAFAQVYRLRVLGTWIRGNGDWSSVQQRARQPL